MKKLLWLCFWVLILSTGQAVAATLNFDTNDGNSNNAVLTALKNSGTCRTWNNAWEYNNGEFSCNAEVIFTSGALIRTNGTSMIIRGNAGITGSNNSVGTTSNRVNLTTTYGPLQISASSTVFGNLQASSGAITVQNSTVNGTINSSGALTLNSASVTGTINISGSASISNGSVLGGNVTVGNGLTATGSVFNGNILSSNGNITLTGGNVAGNISAPSNMITATNTDITGTVTANGDIVLTDVEVNGKVTSTNNDVYGTGTVFGNGISGHSGIQVTGGSIQGDLRSGCNNIILNSTTMSSGTIQTTPTLGSGCAADKIEFNNSTIDADILGGPNNVYVNDTQFTGDIKARFNVELDNSTVYGNISGEPGFALHDVDLQDSTVYGDVTVNNDFGEITGNWPDSTIQGECSYDYVTPSLCGGSSPPGSDAYWKFDETQWSGGANEVIDSSVNLRHGRSRNGANTAVIDPSPASCTFGDFQRGSSSSNNPHVYIGQNAYFHDADDFGFTLWLKMSASQQAGNRQVILAYGDEDGVNEEDEGRFELLRTSAGRLRFAVRMQSEDLRYVEVNGSGVFDGQWKHIAVSYSKQNKRIRLYVDNVLVSSTPNASIGNGNNQRTPNDGNTGLSIGALPDGDHGIRGQLDEVKFFAHEPTAAEIQAMYLQTASCTNECFNENFTNDTNWYLTQRNSTPPSLRTSPSRLRLTENTQNQSTSITFKRSFPAAGNKMTIEFDHYAYGGTGADGIALVLSDASVTPIPGSYGGSLGYAQRTNVSPSQSGFAGGWLGIGFDEFGNFSQATEGRSGGAGAPARPNAIGVRAASSASYGWLGGTNTLSPALSASGSTLARGDRYRITIDSTATNPQKVAFQLERRLTGSSSYSTLLTSTDLLALGQPLPPANLLLSYTGSTGDNTNFHEITNIQVCTQQPSVPIEIGNSVHHYELVYPNKGLTCEAETIEVKACANAACSALVAGSVSTTISATNGGTFVGGNNLTFTGSTTVYLRQTNTGDTTLSLSGASNPTVCSTSGCKINFSHAGFKFYQDKVSTAGLANQVAGVQGGGYLRAVKTNTDTMACEARTVGTRNVLMSFDCSNPASCIAGQTLKLKDTSPLATSSTTYNGSEESSTKNLSLTFDSQGFAPLGIEYSDVGQLSLSASLALAASGNNPAVTLTGQSNAFVVRPHRINVTTALSSATATPANAANPQTLGTGAGFVAAGEAFQLYVSPLNANGDLTPNYGNETSPETVAVDFGQLVHPVGGVNGELTPGAAFTKVYSGTYVNRFHSSGFSWDEVGTINLLARVADNDYLGTGAGAEFSSIPYQVGRFYPKHYRLASSSLENICTAFSYMDQAGIKLAYEIQAKNVADELTLNYRSGYGATAVPTVVLENADNGTDLSSRAIVPASSWVAGKYSLSQTNLSFSKLTTPDGPYSTLMAGVKITDVLDSRDLDVKNMNPTSTGACGASCVAAAITGTLDMRYGRLKLIGGAVEDVPAPSAPAINLPVELEAEYWDGQAFITNSVDDCTAVDSTKLLFSGTPFTAVEGSPATLNSGSSRVPAPQSPSIYFEVTSGTPTGAWPIEYTAPDWLKFNWRQEAGAVVQEDPSSEISVGRFRGNKRQIFWQERLN